MLENATETTFSAPQAERENLLVRRAEREKLRAQSLYYFVSPTDLSGALLYGGGAPSENSSAIPAAIAECWHLVKESQLSEEAFTHLVAAAAGRSPQSVRGLLSLEPKSLAAFLHFWGSVRDGSAEPEIGISPKGHVQAEWTKDVEDFLVLEFRPNGEVLFSLWQDGYPTEGVKSPTHLHELCRMFEVMDQNPLSWTDAD